MRLVPRILFQWQLFWYKSCTTGSGEQKYLVTGQHLEHKVGSICSCSICWFIYWWSNSQSFICGRFEITGIGGVDLRSGVKGWKCSCDLSWFVFTVLPGFAINVFNTLMSIPSYSHSSSVTMLISLTSVIAIDSITEVSADTLWRFESICML